MIDTIGYYTGLIGMWIMSDGMYSWILYLRAFDYKSREQTFWKDHWVRLVRILCGVGLMYVGYLLVTY